MADKLAKEALSKTIIPISYNRAPKSVINRDLEDNSRETWQKEWEKTTKGSTTKEYFPTVVERLKMKINLSQHLTTLCGNGNQTAEHIALECGILREERERLIAAVAKIENWPIKRYAYKKNTTKNSQNSQRWTK